MAVFGISTLMLSRISLGTSMQSVVIPNFINGFGGGFVFVPLTTLSMGLLHKQEMGNGAGVYNLMRNIGGSVGIAALVAFLVRGAQSHQQYLGAHLTAGNSTAISVLAGLAARYHAGGSDMIDAHSRAMGAIYGNLQQQAAVLSYADNFRLLGYMSLACIPLVFFMVQPRHGREERVESVGE
jgi:DHA2 family multidrug resistance protein